MARARPITRELDQSPPRPTAEQLAAQREAFELLMQHSGSVEFHPNFDADKGRWRARR